MTKSCTLGDNLADIAINYQTCYHTDKVRQRPVGLVKVTVSLNIANLYTYSNSRIV